MEFQESLDFYRDLIQHIDNVQYSLVNMSRNRNELNTEEELSKMSALAKGYCLRNTTMHVESEEYKTYSLMNMLEKLLLPNEGGIKFITPLYAHNAATWLLMELRTHAHTQIKQYST